MTVTELKEEFDLLFAIFFYKIFVPVLVTVVTIFDIIFLKLLFSGRLFDYM